MTHDSILFCDERIEPRAAGTLWLPDSQTLIVSDLHLGKSERHARRSGGFWPPYDTKDTLDRLDAEIGGLKPACVVALGDSFDDAHCADQLDDTERSRIETMTAERRWIWVAGNHDPAPVSLGGESATEVTLGPLTLRHIAQKDTSGEISGHYHPKATLRVRGRRIARKCFLIGEKRIILPAFGAYTGGLDVCDPAFSTLFGQGTCAILIGSRTLSVPLAHLRRVAA